MSTLWSSLTWSFELFESSKPNLFPSRLALSKSEEKSNGRLLKDVLCDKRILSVVSYGLSSGDASKCSFIVKNIWNETFDIKPVILNDGNVAFHATKQLI